MESIERIGGIDRLKLSGENYFVSLLEQASFCGILSNSALEKIQLECLSLLAKQTERYNCGSSSSIRIETAQELLASILFTVGLHLKSYISPEDAVRALMEESVEVLFVKGKNQIEEMIKQTRRLHAKIAANLINTPNVFYRSTVIDGIDGFFKLYYPEFGAQKIHITADYPTCNGVFDLTGIEFIKKYLENIYYENLFCANFSGGDIHHLLYGEDENYEELLINIYERVLTSALGCAIAGKDIHGLNLSVSDVSKLAGVFENKTKGEIRKILEEALLEIKTALSLNDNVFFYLNKSLYRINCAIQNAADLKTMERVFIIPAYPETDPVIEFSFGEKMDDARYREVIEEILQCESIENKLKIINEKVNSLSDLEDILLDAELSAPEITYILKTLQPSEFIALLKKYPHQYDPAMLDMREKEKKLTFCLGNYLRSLPKDQQDAIEKALKRLKGNGVSAPME